MVTIGMPVYNGAKFLPEALDSLLAQTYKDIRIVISDNASTDDTQRICREYTKKDSRVCYTRNKENVGPYSNFNSFLEKKIDSEFFMWAACDDFWAPSFLGECIDALTGHPDAVMAFTNLVNIDQEGVIVREYRIDKLFPRRSPASYVKLYCSEGKANLVYGLWRSGALVDARMDRHWGSDMNFVFELLLKGSFIAVDKQLFFKRLSVEEMAANLHRSSRRPARRMLLIHRRNLYRDMRPYFMHLKSTISHPSGGSLYARFSMHLIILYVKLRTLITGKA